MSKLNTDSNGYTIGFLVLMVLIVGGALATLSSMAKPIIDKNIELDNKTKILASVEYAGSVDEVLSDYSSRITAIAVDYKGNIIEGVNGYEINLKKEYRKPLEERQLPVFIYKNEGKTNYILPLIGLGLWDEINGYIAFNADLKTIKGAAFDHVGETPGLGSVITETWFEDRFKDKIVFNDKDEYLLKVHKAGKSPDGTSDVDGLSGATLTGDGVDNMLRDNIPNYKNYFNKLKK